MQMCPSYRSSWTRGGFSVPSLYDNIFRARIYVEESDYDVVCRVRT